MQTIIPYEWLKTIPKSLIDKEEIPSLGFPPLFPWDQFNAILAKLFQLENLSIVPAPWEWKEPEFFTKNLGETPEFFCFDIAPLQGNAFLALASSDYQKLTSLFLTKSPDNTFFIEKEYRKGFWQFLFLEIFSVVKKLEYDKELSPHLVDNVPLEKERPLLMQKLCMTVQEFSCSAHLILSDALRQSWKERFSARKLSIAVNESSAEKLNFVVAIEAAKTFFTLAEWQTVRPGDFIMLDECSLDPASDKHKVILTLGGKPIFRARLKDGEVKILESPLYQEVTIPMTDTDHDDDDDFETDFETDFESEEFGTEEFSEEELSDLDDDDHDDHEDHPHEDHDDDDHDHEDHDDEETKEFDDEKEIEKSVVDKEELGKHKPSEPAKEALPQEKKSKAALLSKHEASKAPLSPENIPLTLIVEVGRIQMSVKKLLELSPGNVLELDIHPENGVDLVVNGNLVGKGELLKIGDALGVRILDKG